MLRRKIKFTDKKHSRPGMVSSALGLASALTVLGLFAAAYVRRGQAGRAVAVLGFLALLLAGAGVYYGVLGMREEDTYRLFPQLGTGLNLLLLAGFAAIYILGW
ncbi:MAG: DUF6142 family protein [Eubacteriales bacterium]|nr:DUF6142 family protein [Eubacteriales bacterium]